MTDDDKNEQSVMIPLDELLAQNPSLGVHLTPQHQSSVDQKKFDRVGLNRDVPHAAAPLNNVVVPMRRTQVHTKKGPGKVLSALSILIGIAALIAVGICIGGIINKKPVEELKVKRSATPARSVRPQKTPTPSPTPKIAPAAAVTATPEEAQPKAQPSPATVAAERKVTKPSKKRKRRRGKAKPAPKAQPKAKPEPKPAPAPEPVAKPKPKPQKSEAASLLSGLQNKRRPSGVSADEDGSTATKPNLPAKLTRSQILSVLRKNSRSVTRCATHVTEKTRVKMRLVVAGSGKVTTASLHEPANLKGSPVETCMIERVKLFKFPTFSAKSLAVKLPFILQKR